jgi:dihydropteroate synthase type 2
MKGEVAASPFSLVHPLVKQPAIFGILNVTSDSFSDGGRYLDTDAALAHARVMADADVIDIGAAASNPLSQQIDPEIEIARLAPVVSALHSEGRTISIDTFSTPVQRWALTQPVAYLNDIHGFSDPSLYFDLASASAKLVVMHAIQREGRATEVDADPEAVFDGILAFFHARLNQLIGAGVERSRLIVDPGMGFFLGSRPESSFNVLRQMGRLKAEFGLPVFISVSRKSFLRKITGREPAQSGPATLAAELFAARQGADFIRTHDPAAFHDAWQIERKLTDPK